MTKTPKTDKAKRKIDGYADEWVPCYVSEELERELERRLTEQIEMLREIRELSEVVGGQEDIRKMLIRFFANV
jgi:hypothetical protein